MLVVLLAEIELDTAHLGWKPLLAHEGLQLACGVLFVFGQFEKLLGVGLVDVFRDYLRLGPADRFDARLISCEGSETLSDLAKVIGLTCPARVSLLLP